MKSVTFLIILIFMMVLNTIYSILPARLQAKPIIRCFGILAAISILIWGGSQALQEYENQIYAHVSVDGAILESKNFPWKISYRENEKEISYCIEERYGDASYVSIKSKKPNPEHKIYNAVAGIAIKFSSKKETLSDFWIYIENP